jgi:serine/threonine-protein kinase
MGQLEAEFIAGTEDARSPFFSPDGQWLGFFAEGKLKKVSVSGGTPVIVCDVTSPRATASWGADESIVLQAHTNSGLFQVPAGGGTPQPLTTLDSESGEGSHGSPQVLPGGKAVLFNVRSAAGAFSIAVQSLETGERRVLLEGAVAARYVPTGHLVYVQGGTLMAVAFDLEQLEVTGDPIPTLQGVMQASGTDDVAHLTFSDTGTLVYVPADSSARAGRTLAWVDRKGAVEPLAAPPREYGRVDLSPDGQRVAVTSGGEVWIYDIRRETLTRLTFERGSMPLWTPDGKRITFQSTRFGLRNLFWKLADGSGAAEQLLASELPHSPMSWSPDGNLLAFVEVHPSTNGDVWMLPLEGEGTPEPFLRTPFSETGPVFSPDGHWLAYRSNESGRYEIYVQPYPSTGAKWQISTEGGEEAVWASSGGELFYRSGDKMMAIDITTEPTFTHGIPQLLFEEQFVRYGPRALYDVAPDGQRFLMIKEGEQQLRVTQLNVVLNWFEELKRLVPTN